MLHQILQVGVAVNSVTQKKGTVPGDVSCGPHGVHPGQSTHIARQNPVERKHERGGRDQLPVGGTGGVLRIAPEGVVVANAMGVMTDVVSGYLVTPWLD